jgi:hypothetical protein
MYTNGRQPPSTLVIDDFFDDFDKARAAALECEFRQRGKAFSYRYATPPPWLEDQGVERIGEILGSDIRDEFIESHLLQATSADWEANLRRGARVHIDEVRWVGVAYLNDPSQCSGGTSFYEHKATRYRHYAQVPSAEAATVLADGGDISRWREIIAVGMVPNRLVLFDPGQFHQAQSFFGDDAGSARLTHHFYFKHVPITPPAISSTLPL